MSRKPKPRQRGARGTGSIFWSKRRGCWVGRAFLGRKPNGKPHYAERSDVSQAKVIEKLKKIEPPGPETTVSQWADRWLEGLAVRPGTKLNYEHNVRNHIKPTLGHLRLRDLTPHQIEQAARKWGQGDDGLGVNTIRLVIGHLSACLSSAVRAGVIATNPVRVARKPRGKKKEIDPFTPGELAAIIADATEHPFARLIAVLAATGCRVGEAQALGVTDFDGEKISITKTVGQIRSHGIGPPKSANSVRTIRVLEAARPAIVQAVAGRRSGFIFQTRTKKYIDKGAVSERFDALLARLKLRRRNLHQLRHSVATHMIAAGVPIGDVAAYLGDTPETIVKTYLHPTGIDPSLAYERLLKGSQGGCKVE